MSAKVHVAENQRKEKFYLGTCEQKNKNSVMRVSFIYERSKCGRFSAPSLLTSSHYSASEN